MAADVLAPCIDRTSAAMYSWCWTCSWARFMSLVWSMLRLCSANHRPGYWSNLPCDWPSRAWAYSKQESISDYAQPITGQVTEVTWPVIGRAQPELTPSKRQKMGPGSCLPWGRNSVRQGWSGINVPSQWEVTLQCNVVPHWLGAFTKQSLVDYLRGHSIDLWMN